MTAARLRTVLVLLALSAGQRVSVDRLATEVWGENLPDHPRRALQTYAGRLRTALGGVRIDSESLGFILHVDPDGVDVLRFDQMLDRAANATDPDAERRHLSEALSMWRGEPFNGVESTWLEHTERPRLLERYLIALERRVDLDIDAGRAGDLVPELRDLTSRHPLRESLWLRLLTALDRCGRQAEALEHYERIRSHIADTLGVDPAPELRALYAGLLNGRGTAAGATHAAGGSTRAPHQLPADISGFTGREVEMKAMHNLLGADPGKPATTICVLTGTAGVGKTTLAVRWAHRAAERFPDGQLYVDLRGFGPRGRASDSAEVVRTFLEALGIPAADVPTSVDSQFALYRSLLADRRVLIVLDNARDAEQVRPLLPGSPKCTVLVTSRNQLTGLIAAQAAHAVTVDVLSAADSRQLLAARLGRDRIEREPRTVRAVIDQCAGLPLALAIVAARAATNPTRSLRALATELREERDRLDALGGHDAATDVRTVFSWSYRAVSTEAARLFRLLGLHPGPDISAPAAASLAGTQPRTVRRLLAELSRAHLIGQHAPGRYRCHDLLRAYAAELADTHDTDADRHAATNRTLDHYLHSAYAASVQCAPIKMPIALDPAVPHVTAETCGGRDQALAWFTTEREVLLAAIGQAGEAGFDTHTWRLAWTMANFLHQAGYWHDQIVVQGIALNSARRLADPLAQAHIHRFLAFADIRLGYFGDAHAHLGRALNLYREADDPAGQAHTRNALGQVCARQGNHAEAIHHAQRALEQYRDIGQPIWQANSLNLIGWSHAKLGNHRRAIESCQQAMDLYEPSDDHHGIASASDSLGYAYRHLGEFEKSLSWYRRALDLYRRLGDTYEEASTLSYLGDVYCEIGDNAAARDAWQRALTILDALGHSDAEPVRAKLHDLRP